MSKHPEYTFPLFGGATLAAGVEPRVYGLVFLSWRPQRERPMSFAMEPDAARELRDALDYLVGDGPEPEPRDVVDAEPVALFPLDELRADRIAGRATRREIAATGTGLDSIAGTGSIRAGR